MSLENQPKAAKAKRDRPHWKDAEILSLCRFYRDNVKPLYNKPYLCMHDEDDKRKWEEFWVKGLATVREEVGGPERKISAARRKFSGLVKKARFYEGCRYYEKGGREKVKINPIYEAVLRALEAIPILPICPSPSLGLRFSSSQLQDDDDDCLAWESASEHALEQLGPIKWKRPTPTVATSGDEQAGESGPSTSKSPAPSVESPCELPAEPGHSSSKKQAPTVESPDERAVESGPSTSKKSASTVQSPDVQAMDIGLGTSKKSAPADVIPVEQARKPGPKKRKRPAFTDMSLDEQVREPGPNARKRPAPSIGLRQIQEEECRLNEERLKIARKRLQLEKEHLNLARMELELAQKEMELLKKH